MGHLYHGELLVITRLGIPREAEKLQLFHTSSPGCLEIHPPACVDGFPFLDGAAERGTAPKKMIN